MGQMSSVCRNNTKVKQTDQELRVTLHNTDVVSATPEKIVLNTGGWFTVTTKARMNQASCQYGLGYRVNQNNGVWAVQYKGQTYQFVDDMCVLPR